VEDTARKLAKESYSIANPPAPAGKPAAGTANKQAADMLLGPVLGLAALPATTTVAALGAVTDAGAGEVAARAGLALLNRTLDALSVSSSPTTLDTFRMRETWLAMTTGPGKTALENIAGIVGGVARLAIGDTKSLGQALEVGALGFNYGWQYGVHDLAYPKVPIGAALADFSGEIIRYLPVTWISALGTGDLWKTANASVEDSENVLLSALTQPVGMVMVVANIGRFLAIGLRDCNDVEEYLRREQAIVAQYPELGTQAGVNTLLALPKDEAALSAPIKALLDLEKKRPFTCTEFEYYVGNARSIDRPDAVASGLLSHSSLPVGVFAQDLVDLAQDTSFWYSGKLLGREQGLIRMARLFGNAVQARLAQDPSLQTDAGLDTAQVNALLDLQGDTAAGAERVKILAREKIRSFDRLEANPDVRVPGDVRKRRQFFVDLLNTTESRWPSANPAGPKAATSIAA
jgi:hypothetical protein